MTENQKESIETPYLSEEVELKRVTPFHVYWEMLKINAWKNFAHHPTCSEYRNHVFNLGFIKLCVGCASLYSALSIYLILYFSLPQVFQQLPLINGIVLLYGLVAVLVHQLIKPEKKWLKAFLRFSLGLGVGGYVSLIVLVPKWWLKLIMVGIFLGSAIAYSFVRSGANMEECESCPMSVADPPCDPLRNTAIKAKKLNNLIDEEIERIRNLRLQQKQRQQIVENNTEDEPSEELEQKLLEEKIETHES